VLVDSDQELEKGLTLSNKIWPIPCNTTMDPNFVFLVIRLDRLETHLDKLIYSKI
jgi:hypothetical protein